MKYRIIVSRHDRIIDFFMWEKGAVRYLFSQPFSTGVYRYFYNGRRADEILGYRKWNANKRLNKTIERIPGMVRYVQREAA